MQLRTFIAKDMREALATVRTEMGTDAVIVSSQRAKAGGVIVRAALDNDVGAGMAPECGAESENGEGEAFAETIEDLHKAALIRRLRGEPPKSAAAGKFSRPELLALLGGHRVPDSIAHDLARTAAQCGLTDMALALACALDRRMKAAPIDIAKKAAFLLVGPNGAGKTAIAAKLAAHARLTYRAAKLVAADTAGAGAVARLETFAKHLDTPFTTAETAESLAKIVAQSVIEDVTAIVDTAGFDPRNGKAHAAFSGLAKLPGIEAVGVVSACGDAEETIDIAGALASLGARRLIVTGTDLIRRLGALVAAAGSGIPIAHVTRSPFVAAGLETLTPLSLARALLDTCKRADEGSTQ